jgi:phage protein U
MFVYLGGLRLQGLMGPTDFREQRKYAFAEHPVVQGRPKLQKIGEELREIDTGFLLHRGYCDPATAIAALRSLAEAQEPFYFILGDGTFAGEYVVEEITSEVEKLDRAGQAVGIEVSVQLKEAPASSTGTAGASATTPAAQQGARVRSTPSRGSTAAAANRAKLGAAV